MDHYHLIVETACNLAESLPSGTAEAVAAILIVGKSNVRSEIAHRVPHHHHRDLALRFVDLWKETAPDLDARTVGIALQAALHSERKHRDAQNIEPVWTGPEIGSTPFRRTEQAILQLIDSAQNRITLVSFAVYRIPNVAKALVRAAERGVVLTVIVEMPDKLEGENEYSTLSALGKKVEDCSSVYFWPKENRAKGDNNKAGILHAKCAVSDGKWLFLSSANLTHQAFTINMELGLIVRGGSIPSRVEQQFERMIQLGILEKI